MTAIRNPLRVRPVSYTHLDVYKRQGLAVFMFTGFVKSISLEIEEAAMIDCCTPLQMYFRVVFPILRPTAVTVAILEAMWVWNDYLLP